MRRTKGQFEVPDAINVSVTKDFVQIPHELLRNPTISGKAKAIQCILLSNREGWKSHIGALKKLMKENEVAIRSGLEELGKAGYLLRVRYRDKQTKVRVGSFWAYTDLPGQLDISQALLGLDQHGLEPLPSDMENPNLENLNLENLNVGIPNLENPLLNILIYNNTNQKTSSSPEAAESNPKITPNQFELFWKIYPKKVDKGKARTAWLKLCNKPLNDPNRPTWTEVRLAIHNQKKTPRWQDPKFIPHPTTFLHQARWLDDPSQMTTFKRDESKQKPGCTKYPGRRIGLEKT